MSFKSRKLFAIFTVIAMMLTLLPAAAFADNGDVDSDVASVKFTKKVYYGVVNKDVELKVTVTDEGGGAVADESVSFTADPAVGATFDPESGVKTDGDGKATVNFTASSPGTYTVTAEVDEITATARVIVSSDEDKFLPSTASRVIDFDDDINAGEEAEFKVSLRNRSGDLLKNTYVSFYVQSSRDVDDLYLDVNGDPAAEPEERLDDEHDPEVDEAANIWLVTGKTNDRGELSFYIGSSVPGSSTITVGNRLTGDEPVDKVGGLFRNGTCTVGFQADDKYEIDWVDVPEDNKIAAGEKFDLAVRVTDTAGWEADDVEVEFFEKKDGRRWSSIGKDTTDSKGDAKITVRLEDAADYEYYVKVDGKSFNDDDEILDITVVAGSPYSIKAHSDSYYYEEGVRLVRFLVFDRYGNQYDQDALEYHEDGEPFEVIEFNVTDPDGDETTVDSPSDCEELYLDGDDTNRFRLEYDFDKEGEWEVEAFIVGTSISATTVVNIGEFGDEEKIEIDIDKKFIRARDGESVSAVLNGELEDFYTEISADLFDENGIKKAADLDDVAFSSSNRSLASIHEKDGKVYAVAGDDVSGTVTITVIHLDTGLEDSAELTIGGVPAALEVEVDNNGLEADVTLTLLDGDGNKTTLADDEEEGYRLFLPAGLDYSDMKDFEIGEATATFTLKADEYDTYSVRVVTDLGIATTFDVTFSEAAEGVADQVKMIIGSKGFIKDGELEFMDVAPFIEDDRTFVPIRFIAEAFGLDPEEDIDWEPKVGGTEYVYFYLEDATVTITIGSDTILVEYDDGEVEEIEMDVAAFIRDGRTFLPIRFTAYALGLSDEDFDWGPKEGATEWVSFNLK